MNINEVFYLFYYSSDVILVPQESILLILNIFSSIQITQSIGSVEKILSKFLYRYLYLYTKSYWYSTYVEWNKTENISVRYFRINFCGNLNTMYLFLSLFKKKFSKLHFYNHICTIKFWKVISIERQINECTFVLFMHVFILFYIYWVCADRKMLVCEL